MKVRVGALVVSVLAVSCGSDGPRTPTSPNPVPDPSVLQITCPPAVVASTTAATAPVSYPTPTTTGGQAPVTITCSPFSGASFPIGTTTVACQAVDARNTAAACSFTVLVSKVPLLTRTRFLAFGDSTTAGEVTVPSTTGLAGEGGFWAPLVLVPAASYPSQLLELLRTRYTAQNTFEVANAGVSGEVANPDGAARFPGVMTTVRPEAVLLLEGYNDLNLYGSSGVSRGISALESMSRSARARGVRVFMASLTPSRPGGRNTVDPTLIAAFNDRVRTLAAAEGAVFVDLHGALVTSLNTYIGTDGLHPTEAGYRRMAEEFFVAIRATLEAP